MASRAGKWLTAGTGIGNEKSASAVPKRSAEAVNSLLEVRISRARTAPPALPAFRRSLRRP